MGEHPASKVITLAQLGEHNRVQDLWVAVHGKVYDLTSFGADHPGGIDVLKDCAGTDGSEVYDYAGHSFENVKALRRYCIGMLPGTASSNDDMVNVREKSPSIRTIGAAKAAALSRFTNSQIRLRPLIFVISSALALPLLYVVYGRGGGINKDIIDNSVAGSRNPVTAFLGGLLLASSMTGAGLLFAYSKFQKTLEHTNGVNWYPAVIPKRKRN